MTKKICFLRTDLESDRIQAAIKSVIAQNKQDTEPSVIVVSPEDMKQIPVIVAAKLALAEVIVIKNVQKTPEELFIEEKEKFEDMLNEKILTLTNQPTVIPPSACDVLIRQNNRKGFNNKKKIEKILKTRYLNPKFNQLKKITHTKRTRQK